MERTHRALAVLAAGAAAIVVLSVPRGAPVDARLPPPPADRVPVPVTTLLHNDPRRAPDAISDAIVANVDAVPSGERIDVSTYWISSRRIAAALRRAFERGVQVRIVFAGNRKARRFAAGRALARLLNRDPRDGSWVLWSAGAARGRGGIMHQKSYRFSRVGDARWVVVNGSYNSAASSDRHTYALMWQVVGDQGLYDAFATIGAEQAAQRTVPRPLRSFEGPGWEAYFMPVRRATPRSDPVLRRLRSIPPRGAVIKVSMYSMWGPRADWLAARLATMSRRGARITLVAGPTVALGVQARLRAAGVRVRPGCFRDGSFTHAKDMAATFVRDGAREHWTWVGSDNWTSRGMYSDEAVVGIAGKPGYQQFEQALRLLTQRRDGVPTRACRPRRD